MDMDALIASALNHQQAGLLMIILLVERSMGKTKYGSIMGFVLSACGRILWFAARLAVKILVAINTKRKGKNDVSSTSR